MNNINNRFWWIDDNVRLGVHLKQLWFSYTLCGLFTKDKERTQKFKQWVR